MDIATKNILREIGLKLDQGIFPRVSNGGFVLPSEHAVAITPLGKEKYYEYEKRPRRSTTEPWARTGQWKGASGRSPAKGPWQTRNSAPILSSGPAVEYREELSEICEAYPNTQVWEQAEGFWLCAESALLPRLQNTAAFVVGVSTAKRVVRSWGFWQSTLGMSWIGPRHTNFPDGSICAYDPRDFTWIFGQPLVSLLDIYSVWAFRHLHLDLLGRWPGPQIATIPYEVVLEVQDKELCLCGSMRQYADCCKELYSSRNLIADAVDFCLTTGGGRRHPPASILQFAHKLTQPPSICQFT